MGEADESVIEPTREVNKRNSGRPPKTSSHQDHKTLIECIDQEAIRRCLSSECSFCRENCPAYRGGLLDSYSSRGKNRILQAFLQDQVDISEVADLAFTCTMCGQCAEVCLTDGAIFDQVQNIREALQIAGKEPAGLKQMVAYIREQGSPYGKPDPEFLNDIDTPEKGRTAYFPGCTMQARFPELASKTLRLLKKLGINAVPVVDHCCGLPVLEAGFTGDTREMAMDLRSELKKRRISTIITSCAGCAHTLGKEYPELISMKIKVIHITQVLMKHGKKLQRVLGMNTTGTTGDQPDEKTVLYHDPCILSRKLDIMDEPRQLLELLGYHVIEFTETRNETACCGGGGGFARNYPENSSSAAGSRIRDAQDLKTDQIVTACLNCTMTLGKEGGRTLRVLDILQLPEFDTI